MIAIVMSFGAREARLKNLKPRFFAREAREKSGLY